MGVPIRTSRGAPRGWQGELPAWAAVYPTWPMRQITDRDEFTRRYLARLDGYGVEHAAADLAAIADETNADTLILCCFEVSLSERIWCHRSVLAAWLSDRLGIDVPELGAHR
ncbi:hypothetical protein G419_16980 [Rhodococcus triatomae BKS 15-14]|nr:hypothetical protein G419_16980 [Rhodococcus triatomae BKS 15-14]